VLDPTSIVLGLFGGAGGLLVLEQYRHRHDLRRRGADVLGPIFAMLIEADPDRIAINAGPHSHEQLKDLWERSSKYDAELQALAIELPRPGSNHLVELAGAIQRSLNRTNWLLNCVLLPAYQGYDLVQAREDAVEKHAEARKVAEALRDDLRQLARPRLPGRS
jgi:hypothetical protein